MEISGIDITYRFSGKAGEFQRAQATASLVRELGDQYDQYHAELATKLSGLGPMPEIERGVDSVVTFAEWGENARELLGAETALRRCRQARQPGGSLKASLSSDDPPLVDSSHRLLSAVDGSPAPGARALTDPSKPRMPKMPDWGARTGKV